MDKNLTEYSDLKILCHPEKVKDIIEGRRTAPIYVRIKPTNICNQKCYYCAYANDEAVNNREVDRRVSIPWDKLQEVIEDLAQMGTKAVTFTGGGEPLCYPHIEDAIRMVRERGIDYSMISNGQALFGPVIHELAHAKWVRISLDSGNADTYQRIRGVKTYEKVIENVTEFARVKADTCVLGINFVVTSDNFDQVYEVCKVAHRIGVNNIKFAPLMLKEGMAEYHSKIKANVSSQIEQAKRDFEGTRFHIIDKYDFDPSVEGDFEKQYSNCCIKQIFTVIAADSKVYFCHQRAYTPEGVIGDISKQSFREMWFSEETTNRFNTMDAKKECNFRCVFEERNQLLNSLVNMDKNHINFI